MCLIGQLKNRRVEMMARRRRCAVAVPTRRGRGSAEDLRNVTAMVVLES